MSKPAKQIPMGILVSFSSTVRKPERPTPQRKVVLRTPAQQHPWRWIVMGGSIAMVLLILVIGLCIGMQKRSQQAEPQSVAQPIALVPPVPASKPVARERPVVEPKVAEFVVEPPAKPIVEAPKPARAEVQVVRKDKMPPFVAVNPGMEDTISLQELKPQELKSAEVPEPKSIDPSPFANCKQIGTNVLFLKDPLEAFKRAKAEKKMVFIMHLSGNLEDTGFT